MSNFWQKKRDKKTFHFDLRSDYQAVRGPPQKMEHAQHHHNIPHSPLVSVLRLITFLPPPAASTSAMQISQDLQLADLKRMLFISFAKGKMNIL